VQLVSQVQLGMIDYLMKNEISNNFSAIFCGRDGQIRQTKQK